MNQRPKFIFLNGPAGIGKTTIAQRYLDEHPLAMSINDDQIITMMGQWLTHESEARQLVFQHVQHMAAHHLKAGYTVIVPYLLQRLNEVERFAAIAAEQDVDFYEILLMTDKEQALSRLMRRGTWGEVGAPPITEADRPVIEHLYEGLQRAVAQRPRTITIDVVNGAVDRTYSFFLQAIGEAAK
jgi:predicted kinase